MYSRLKHHTARPNNSIIIDVLLQEMCIERNWVMRSYILSHVENLSGQAQSAHLLYIISYVVTSDAMSLSWLTDLVQFRVFLAVMNEMASHLHNIMRHFKPLA